MFKKIRGKNQNKHFMASNVFQKLCLLWDNMEKYGRSRQVTDDIIILGMLLA